MPTQLQSPVCVDINECLLNPNICNQNSQTNLTCSNTIGSFLCLCANGQTPVNGQCSSNPAASTAQTTVASQQTTTTALATTNQSNTGLILAIVLPILIVLLLITIAGVVCFFWFRM